MGRPPTGHRPDLCEPRPAAWVNRKKIQHALKGQTTLPPGVSSKAMSDSVMRVDAKAAWDAPSGLFYILGLLPRALPWAVSGQAVGLGDGAPPGDTDCRVGSTPFLQRHPGRIYPATPMTLGFDFSPRPPPPLPRQRGCPLPLRPRQRRIRCEPMATPWAVSGQAVGLGDGAPPDDTGCRVGSTPFHQRHPGRIYPATPMTLGFDFSPRPPSPPPPPAKPASPPDESS
jgi:hypothetical protein